MSPSAHVRSIQALSDLKAGLARFSEEARSPLRKLAQELRRTQEWLGERRRHWQFEVRKRGETLRHAQEALARCRASARYDATTGRRHVPDCGHYELAVLQAQNRLLEAKEELHKAQQWIQRLAESEAAYKRQVRRFEAFLEGDLAKGQAMLERKITALRAYTSAAQVPRVESGTSGSIFRASHPGRTGFVSTPRPMNMPLVATRVIQQVAGDLHQQLSTDTGMLQGGILAEKVDQTVWEEIQALQTDRGWSQIFAAKDLPVVTAAFDGQQQSRLSSGQNGQSKTDLPEWPLDQELDSGIWEVESSLSMDERLALLVQELGLYDTKVAVVVDHTQEELASVYCREIDADAWQLLQDQILLADVLAEESTWVDYGEEEELQNEQMIALGGEEDGES